MVGNQVRRETFSPVLWNSMMSAHNKTPLRMLMLLQNGNRIISNGFKAQK